MIIIDENDPFLLVDSLGDLVTFQSVEDFTEMSGADLMVSPINRSALNERLLHRHIAYGAKFYKIYNTLDFADKSIPLVHLFKMRELGACQSQCVLLAAGLQSCNAQGFITVSLADNAPINTKHRFVDVMLRISAWNDAGGTWLNIPNRAALVQFILEMDKTPNTYGPFGSWQKIIMDLVGLREAERLFSAMEQEHAEVNLFTALIWLTEKPIAGDDIVPEKVRRAVREILGLKDGYKMRLEVDND